MNVKLKDLVDVHNGYQFRGKVEPSTDPDAIPYIQFKDVDLDNGLILGDVVSVMPEVKKTKAQIVEKFGVQQGDVLYHSRGAQPFATAIEFELDATIVTSNFFVLRPKPELIIPGYLAWSMNHPRFIADLLPFSQGSHIKTIKKSALLDSEILVPDIATQQRIAKIEGLRRMEVSLFQQIQIKRHQLINSLCLNAADTTK